MQELPAELVEIRWLDVLGVDDPGLQWRVPIEGVCGWKRYQRPRLRTTWASFLRLAAGTMLTDRGVRIAAHSATEYPLKQKSSAVRCPATGYAW